MQKFGEHSIADPGAREEKRMAKPRSKKVDVIQDPPVDQTPVSNDVERSRIAERAYELYVNRGREEGRDVDDWLEAERELTTSAARTNSDK